MWNFLDLAAQKPFRVLFIFGADAIGTREETMNRGDRHGEAHRRETGGLGHTFPGLHDR